MLAQLTDVACAAHMKSFRFSLGAQDKLAQTNFAPHAKSLSINSTIKHSPLRGDEMLIVEPNGLSQVGEKHSKIKRIYHFIGTRMYEAQHRLH